MLFIVASNKDIASKTIKKQILNHYPFQEISKNFDGNPTYTYEINGETTILITLNHESFNAQDLIEKLPTANLIVFISRHSSQSGKPTLSVHTTGNFANAELGGLPKTLSVAPAGAMQIALKELLRCKESLGLNYEVSYECTHHGPSLDAPTMFVELGSSEQQWSDEVAAKAVARAAVAAVANFSQCNGAEAVLGIGGTHYNQKFTLMALMGQANFGHMVPKYAVSQVGVEMLRQCITKTCGRVSLALLDWKGIKSEDKPSLLSALETVGLPYQKV